MVLIKVGSGLPRAKADTKRGLPGASMSFASNQIFLNTRFGSWLAHAKRRKKKPEKYCSQVPLTLKSVKRAAKSIPGDFSEDDYSFQSFSRLKLFMSGIQTKTTH